MKFLQKRTVAVAAMVLAILCAVVIGQVKKPDDSQQPSTSIVGSYTYVYDYSGVLSDQTMKYVDAMNASLFAQTGGQILIQVVNSTGGVDLETYAIDLGNKYQIGDVDRDNGLVLVLALKDISSGGLVGDYWVEPGDGIYKHVDELDRMCRAYLENDFAAGKYDDGVKKTFDAYIDWYEDLYNVTVKENYIPAVKENFSAGNGYYTRTEGYVETSFGSLLAGLFILMIILLIIWVIADAIRWNRYQKRYLRPGMGRPTVTYYPVFWGRPRRRVVISPRPKSPPRTPPRNSTSGGFGGGNYRSGGRSSFGGGGSFGGSSVSRSSRSGSYGGSRSGGRSSFGGGGSFGGSRGGRSFGGRSGGGGGRRGR